MLNSEAGRQARRWSQFLKQANGQREFDFPSLGANPPFHSLMTYPEQAAVQFRLGRSYDPTVIRRLGDFSRGRV